MTTQVGVRWLRVALGVLGVVLVLSVAGCGGNAQDTSTVGPASDTGAKAGGAKPASAKDPAARIAELEANDSRSTVEEAELERLKAGGGGAAPSSAASPAAGAIPGASQATQVAGTPPADSSKPPKRRRDPFAPWWDTNPVPPVLSLISPVRLAPPHVGEKPPEQKNVEIQEPPTLRVSGMMTGSGVYALLEGAEGQLVVKPGDSVGAYRVESIRPSAVVLKRQSGHITYTMVVPLSDASLGGTNTYGSGYARPGGTAPY
jgi:hypothetical protein